MITRKEFVLGGAALALTGCSEIPPQLRPTLRRLEPEEGPFEAPAALSVNPISHVLSRASFGPRGSDYQRVRAMAATPEEAARRYIEEQLSPESIDDLMLDRALQRIDSLEAPRGELYEYKYKVLLHDMTRAAVLRAAWSKRQLYEKMVNFWTDHFNIDSSKGECRWLKAADDRDVIRKHALGSFPELLKASALSPAMLWYLDGRVNRKQKDADKPNENYARELLELHTLGIHSGYTQRDVMEVARCLTGWTVRTVNQFFKGRVEFHAEQHDDGSKLVLGETIPAGGGERDFDRVLQIVSLHPATARHIAQKLCRHFIADEPPVSPVEKVRDSFLSSRGDIRAVLRTLFATAEFQVSRRSKIKRPFEFVVSALRATQAETDAGPAIFDYLVRLGHAPYQYPTPEGYSDRSVHWMGTLLWRWKFAVALSRNEIRGTTVRIEKCRKDFGGESGLTAHILGRQPAEGELTGSSPTDRLALLLASPEFQRC